jgi:hypothetical protein
VVGQTRLHDSFWYEQFARHALLESAMRSVRFDVGPSFASAVLASIHAIATLMANRFIEVLLACNFRSSFSANFQLEPAFSVPRKERSKVVAKRREYFEAGPQFQQFVREQFQSFANGSKFRIAATNKPTLSRIVLAASAYNVHRGWHD